MTSTSDRPLVVGIDEAPQSQLALRWAVEEARSRGCPLHIVSAYELTTRPPEYELVSQLGAQSTLRDRFDEAVAFAFERLGADRVSHAYVAGHPAQVLLNEAASAAALVVGSTSRSPAAAVLIGSVSGAVAAHAICPVVVVRAAPAGPAAGPVVVGMDSSPHSDQAARVAFEQAHGRGLPLKVVHCSSPLPGYADPGKSPGGILADEPDFRERWIEERLAPLRKDHPDVRVSLHLVEGRPADELIACSAHATIVVVGSRGHGGIGGLLLGSVSQALLHHARCTVIVAKDVLSPR